LRVEPLYAKIGSSVLLFIGGLVLVWVSIYFAQPWMCILAGWCFRAAMLRDKPKDWISFGGRSKL
jgi:hypothetical protein